MLPIAIFHLFVGATFALNSISTTFNHIGSSRAFGITDGKPTSRCYAYIFPGPEDNGDCTYGISGSYFHDEEAQLLPKPAPASTAFMDFINREAAALARLAVAYSPADRTIDIKNINQVKLLTLSDGHIDIEAIVCDHVACVSLAVPVSFPSNCSSKSQSQAEFEHCVIGNLGELDRLACETIEKLVADQERESQEIDAFRNQFGKPLL
jgi:hypothetical protein